MKERKSKERGITLIALLVTIVILIIISAVALQGLKGEDSLIASAEEVTTDYDIMQYKEQIEQKVRGSIVKYAAREETAGLEEIGKDLKEEKLWIKEVSVNLDVSISNEDITVIVEKGYIYQIYYNSIYGVVYVEYIGKEINGEVPKLKARIEGNSIITEPKGEKVSIKTVEVIHEGRKEDITEGKTYTIPKEEGGWYKVKVTGSNNNLRYAWLKQSIITDTLKMPEIKVTPEKPDGENNWYKTRPKVEIEAKDNPNAKEIHYTIIGKTNEEKIISASTTANITTIGPGITKITAWVEDGKGRRSKEVTKTIKYDNVKPEITNVKINHTGGEENNGWIKGQVEIEIEAKDEVRNNSRV